jgi:hypothetical protein
LIYLIKVYKVYALNYKLYNITNLLKRSKKNSKINFKLKTNKYRSNNIFFNTKIIQTKKLINYSILGIFNYFFLYLYKLNNNYYNISGQKKNLLFLLLYYRKICLILQKYILNSKQMKRFKLYNQFTLLKFKYASMLFFFFF